MAHPKATRDKLRQLYANQGHSLEMAADMANVSIGTARRWRDEAKAAGDDWEKWRAANTLAGGSMEEIARGILAAFLVQFQSTMDSLENETDIENRTKMLASLGDSYTKIVSANKRILPEVQEAAVAIKVVGRLADYIDEHHPRLLGDFLTVLQGFEKVIEKEF